MIEAAPLTSETHRSYLDVSSVLDGLAESKEFTESREQGLSVEHALTKSARSLAHDMSSGEDEATPEQRKLAHFYTIISQLPDFTHGLEAVRHHHQVEPLSKRVVEASKLHLVEFNRAIQDLLRDDPTIEFDELVEFLSTMHGVLNRTRWGDDHDEWHKEAAWFRGQAEKRIHGMQQEIFGEQIARAIPGVVIEQPTDPRDDLRGIDRWVTMDGVRFPVDFKASYAAARHAREKSLDPEHIVYTGVEGPRFRKVLRLDAQDIALRTDQMHRHLEQAKEAYQRRQRQRMGYVAFAPGAREV
ncbi:MAG: hypothetical protein ABIP74_03275 [Candidatus Saccharimonas sp.]